MGASRNRLIVMGLYAIAVAGTATTTLWGQGFPQANPGPAPTASAATLGSPADAPPPARNEPPQHVQIVDNASPPPPQGQVWREYDLRPYLTRVRGMENPQQPVIDWILRETGTDRWLGDVPGMLSYEGDKLRVYHVPEVHDKVANVVDRFINPDLSKHSVAVRLITIESTNWRATALPLMEPVRVDTPGVQAWTLSRENAARVGAQLRNSFEYRVHNSANVQIGHGQTHAIEHWQPRTYPERLQQTPTTHPGYQVLMGEIREGYSLQLSPLASSDGKLMEVVIKINVDQIEKMTSVSLNMNSGNSLLGGGVEIQVPQVSSWRLYERFRWPTDHVLVISRGMVAMPGLRNATANPLSSIMATAPARADALLILDCKQATAGLTNGGGESARVGRVNYHGRY